MTPHKYDNFVIEQDATGNYCVRLAPELFKLLKQSYDDVERAFWAQDAAETTAPAIPAPAPSGAD